MRWLKVIGVNEDKHSGENLVNEVFLRVGIIKDDLKAERNIHVVKDKLIKSSTVG